MPPERRMRTHRITPRTRDHNFGARTEPALRAPSPLRAGEEGLMH